MKRNGNKNSVPRIANTCDSKDLDMALTPNWGESRGVKQFACSSSSRLHVELTKDFSLFQTFLLNSTLEKKKQTPSLFQRGHDPMKISFLTNRRFPLQIVHTWHSFHIAAWTTRISKQKPEERYWSLSRAGWIWSAASSYTLIPCLFTHRFLNVTELWEAC